MGSLSLRKIHEDLLDIKGELKLLRNLIAENFELSDWAKKELKSARKSSKKKYVSQSVMEKEFL